MALDAAHEAALEQLLAEAPALTPEQSALVVRVCTGTYITTPVARPEQVVDAA